MALQSDYQASVIYYRGIKSCLLLYKILFIAKSVKNSPALNFGSSKVKIITIHRSPAGDGGFNVVVDQCMM